MRIEENVPLAPYTTLGVGGPARWFARVTQPTELLEALPFARARRLPVLVMGGGSNLLVADEGFPGLVIHAVFGERAIVHPAAQGYEPKLNPKTMTVTVEAGMVWDEFVRSICEQGISGVECLAGIPGLVGGSPIQNIGAYGQEVASSIRSVTALDLETQEYVALEREACGFGYRSSVFNSTQRNRYIVTAVGFQFDLEARPKLAYADLARHFAGASSAPTPLEVYHAVRTIRACKGMLLVEGDADARSAGSFFKNPLVEDEAIARLAHAAGVPHEEIPRWPSEDGMVKLSAAWLMERAGFHKGLAIGRAGLSSKHVLAIVNRGGATAVEIVALRDAVVREVEGRFGIRLEQEPVMVGF